MKILYLVNSFAALILSCATTYAITATKPSMMKSCGPRMASLDTEVKGPDELPITYKESDSNFEKCWGGVRIESSGPDLSEDDLAFTTIKGAKARLQASWREILGRGLKQSSESFRYLVHASDLETPKVFKKTLRYVTESPFVSATLIYPGHVQTFFSTPVGFILEAQPESIIAITNGDMRSFTKGRTREQVRDWEFEKTGILTPATLLRGAYPNAWNEFLLENQRPGDLKPIAVFILIEKDGSPGIPLTQEQFTQIHKMAKKIQLPIIEIKKE